MSDEEPPPADQIIDGSLHGIATTAPCPVCQTEALVIVAYHDARGLFCPEGEAAYIATTVDCGGCGRHVETERPAE